MSEPRWFRVLRVVGLTGLALFVLVPLYVMVTSAVKPLSRVQDRFEWLPGEITFQPFVDMWSTVPLATYFRNSVVVAAGAAVLSVAIAVLAAYAISRYRFRGRDTFRIVVLSTQMFPGILFLLPLYLIYATIGQVTGIALHGSQVGLIITYLTFSLPFSTWMLVGYFDSIPRDLDEAALIDGAGPVGALVRVVLPAARPGIAAVGIYSFMTAWGETLFASIMTDSGSRTLAVGLREYSTQSSVYWNEVMAASLVVSIPVVVGFLFLQRYLAQGLTAGAVK
ncbi:multiple sugar transport system permease protein [Saccharopolyspora antimicrobica]|uniref:Carbohydrate ABC transporter membrane protein 2 (CUT1 family) n=2 Tax=Saccharopolyspora TaxID=1835 RepID=A0A1I5LPJ4_9PSEU|nr:MULTISPECIES: carbohydrate ABC transporter permease [Saccharopolyspora]RKT87856.1 carbohydrate ABC transporter membrane protein 2 (CUT1 family) [Saccharopolyspora antimicrobica]SEG13423.1 carbohydrate ABC transporter membrane protein 2, CUT1 family (TC 3.A.1.1.-) [Saccharopolyspora kobensis]SFE39950.1 carbohydrate ABC transporter membrane protein 2, CUT1 family [Saccharopolyspora kobensis]SFO99077.1 multiple sugar transport system permease protein [Saccharopolyspora antimicrobica]